MNYGEGDQLSEKMSALGHQRVDDAKSADIVILNTCTVVDTTEKKMIKRMNELKKEGKKVIVTGCMAKVQPSRIRIRLPDSIILPPDCYSYFSEDVSRRYGTGTCSEEAPVSNILPIAQGCLGKCSYCITKLARGWLRSYDPDKLVERFDLMVKSGIKEILVTAQDTGCYGSDIGTSLPALLRKMLKNKGDFMIRIGMMNPDSLVPIMDDLLDVMKDPRIYRFLHIPLQSGSADVLLRMNRKYSVLEFKEIVRALRTRYPEISIATDMIAGFPGETDEDHKESLELIEELMPDTVNITRFSSRPGTKAASMEQVHGRISQERSAELTETKMKVEYKNNAIMYGRIEKALITEHGKKGTMIARTMNYRPVAIECDLPIGTFVNVKIFGCAYTHLFGQLWK